MGHKHMRISWSGLLRFEECPRRDYLVRNKAVPKGAVDQRNFLVGSITDNCMREWLDQDDPIVGDLVPRADEMLERWVREAQEKGKIVWRGSEAEDRKKMLADAREALTKLEPWLCENVLPYDYQPEARGVATVNIPDQAGELHRVELFYAIDILVRRDGLFTVYDLKTTRNENYVKGKTLGQLPFYGLAISAAFDIPLREVHRCAFVTPLTRTMETEVYPSADDYRYLMSRITAYAQAVWAGNMPTKRMRDSGCDYRCEVKSACPMGQTPSPDSTGRVSFDSVARLRNSGRMD